MTRTSVGLRFAVAFSGVVTLGATALPLAAQVPVDPSVTAESRASELYTVEELDNLLAPVALYPDPILAQLLVAATYPDEIALANRYVRTYGTRDLDEQPWNLSVRAIAHYAPVLNLLADRPDWAVALGQAYAMQPGDVMASVQSLRRMARAQGNLQTTNEQRIEYEPDEIRIVPAQPRVIYVPVYDPEIVYVRPVHYHRVRTSYWSFGVGFPIGSWLSYDFDWGRREVYYHGWNHYGYSHRWYHVSRPYIAINSIYVGRHVSVSINTWVTRRRVYYDDFGRYNTIHRRVTWNRPGLPGRNGNDRWDRDDDRGRYGIPTGRNAVVNKPGKNEPDRVVPVVNRSRVPGGRQTPDRTPDRGPRNDPGRGNGGDRNDDRNRVAPIRIGGKTGGMDVPRNDDNGTWNPRPERTVPDAGRYAPRGGSGNTGKVSKNAPSGGSPSRGYEATSSTITRSEPYRQPSPSRTYESGPSRTRSVDAPRAVKSPKGGGEWSAPQASQPRGSQPRSSQPRASEPRASQPRISGSNSAPRQSSGGGGGGGKGPKGGKQRD
ncbi:MAG: DUF3300 domain-containing protein [Gemmatimonadaceae bacterium]